MSEYEGAFEKYVEKRKLVSAKLAELSGCSAPKPIDNTSVDEVVADMAGMVRQQLMAEGLPPLPESLLTLSLGEIGSPSVKTLMFDANQMQAYAREAVLAERERCANKGISNE